MPSQEIYTEANSRLHTILGVYLALRAWIAGAEAVVISRESLQRTLDLKNLHASRIDQLCGDNHQFFPHHEVRQVDPGAKVVALVLARSPLPSKWVRQNDAPKLASALSDAGVRTIEVELPLEEEIVSLLAQLTHGLEVSL